MSISASPQLVSSTYALLTHVNRRILGAGHTVRTLQVRDLPARALLSADVTDQQIHRILPADRAAVGSHRRHRAGRGVHRRELAVHPVLPDVGVDHHRHRCCRHLGPGHGSGAGWTDRPHVPDECGSGAGYRPVRYPAPATSLVNGCHVSEHIVHGPWLAPKQ